MSLPPARSSFTGIILTGALMSVLPVHQVAAGERMHTNESFSFVANGSMENVFPLFGAGAERNWAPDWTPSFLWPAPDADREGMVFQVAHERGQAIWINTVFDRAHGHVQYVYVLPDIVATLITLEVRPHGATTSVDVRYERTALTPSADSIVQNMATHDRLAGPEWAEQINTYLREHRDN